MIIKTVALLLFVVVFSIPAITAQSVAQASASPLPASTPAQADVTMITTEKDLAKVSPPATVVTPTPTATPEPTPTPSAFERKFTFSGGLDLGTRYHGSNGEVFRASFDQFAYLNVAYQVSPRVKVYGGIWGAVQFKEIDLTAGVTYEGDKWSHTGEYLYFVLLDDTGNIPVHNFNYEITRSLVKTDRFSATAFGRIEYYKARAQDNLTSGTYLLGGVYTETELGKGWTLSVTPKMLYDMNGAFSTNSGLVFFTSGGISKQFGKITMGPGFKFSTDISTGNRPTLFTGYWSISF